MRKGYVVNVSVEDVKKTVEKALSAKGVKLAVLNEFTNMANAEFPQLGYAWFSWRAKDDGSTAVMIESRTSEGVEAAYDLLFKAKKAPAKKKAVEAKKEAVKKSKSETKSETKKAPTKKKTTKKTEKKAEVKEVKEEKNDQGVLPISELGLKGNAAKAFVEASKAKTLGDVAKLSVADLEAMSGVGPKTVEKIVAKMAEFGFKIK